MQKYLQSEVIKGGNFRCQTIRILYNNAFLGAKNFKRESSEKLLRFSIIRGLSAFSEISKGRLDNRRING